MTENEFDGERDRIRGGLTLSPPLRACCLSSVWPSTLSAADRIDSTVIIYFPSNNRRRVNIIIIVWRRRWKFGQIYGIFTIPCFVTAIWVIFEISCNWNCWVYRRAELWTNVSQNKQLARYCILLWRDSASYRRDRNNTGYPWELWFLLILLLQRSLIRTNQFINDYEYEYEYE